MLREKDCHNVLVAKEQATQGRSKRESPYEQARRDFHGLSFNLIPKIMVRRGALWRYERFGGIINWHCLELDSGQLEKPQAKVIYT
jgi:hypothetical protein